MATGVKIWLVARWRYLDCFLFSACAATVPASAEAKAAHDHANVSGHVASQTRSLPFFHVTTDTPSGLFPSEWWRPAGTRPCVLYYLMQHGNSDTPRSFGSSDHEHLDDQLSLHNDSKCGAYRKEHLSASLLQWAQYHHPYAGWEMVMGRHGAKLQLLWLRQSSFDL